MPKTHGHLYVLESEIGAVKIGASSSPARRISAIKKLHGRAIIREFVSDEVDDNYAIESKVKKILSDQRIDGEWFLASFGDMVEIVKNLVRVENNRRRDETLTKRYYTKIELSKELGCHINTITKMISMGLRCLHLYKGSRSIVICADDLQAFLNENSKELAL